MADLTIHELQNEATAPAANDYMALDGATAGTRKITPANLATWIHNKWAAFINAITPLKTSFASGDKIPVVNGSTATAMSKDTLLELTAQNALAGKVAEEFVPNSTTTVAGYPYAYGGGIYIAKISGYQGAFDANKFTAYPAMRYVFNLSSVTAKPFDPERTNDNKYYAGDKVISLGNLWMFIHTHYGAWSYADAVQIDDDMLMPVIVKAVTSTKHFYIPIERSGERFTVKLTSSDWTWTDTSSPVVIAAFNRDYQYTYYQSYSIEEAISNELIFDIPEKTTYIEVLVRLDSGCTVNAEIRNAGCSAVVDYSAEFQGPDFFEMGNVTMVASGNAYATRASTTRVRPKKTFHLYKGDRIVVDPSLRYYINVKETGANSWSPSGWKSGIYNVKKDCEFCILFRTDPEADTSVEDICSKFFVISAKSELKASKRLASIYDSSLNEKIKTFSFSGRGQSQLYSEFIPVVPGKMYKVEFPAQDLDGVTLYYINRSVEFDGGKIFWYRVKGEATMPAQTVYIPIPYNVHSMRVSIRSKSGDSVAVKVSEFVPPINSYNFRSVAHRGSWFAVENTVPSYEIAAFVGYKYAETDVAETSDGYLVCLHDSTVDRLSNGTGNISEMTLAEAKALAFNKNIPSESYFYNTKIATFGEVLEACKRTGLHLYIDFRGDTETYLAKVVNHVKRYGMVDNVSFIGAQTVLAYIKSLLPSARVGLLCYAFNQGIVDTLLTLSTRSDHKDVFVDAEIESITAERAEICANSNVVLETWTTDLTDIEGAPNLSGATTNSLLPPSIIDKIGRFTDIGDFS